MSRRRIPAHIAHGTETAVDDYRCTCAVCVEMNSIKRHRGNLRPARLHLTDNGFVYTSRFTHGHKDFERLRASLGITQKDGHPGHPKPKARSDAFTKPSNGGSSHEWS